MKTNEQEKLYRNTACLCARPLLTQRPEERGANLYRCITCGGWRRIPPADADAEHETEPDDRVWYEIAILVLILIALAAVLIADATLRQNMQLLQEVIRK